MTRPEEENDHYSTLGADEWATREEIERLYKGLARRHHPDRGGDEERMKSINEAYRVLRDEVSREAYDAGRGHARAGGANHYYNPDHYSRNYYAQSVSPPAKADAIGGRILGAWLCMLAGLVLLFLVRFHYVRFLWPLAMLAGMVVLMGVAMAHGALVFARRHGEPRALFGRFVWAQEAAFWSFVCAGAYGVYLLLTAI
jgi:DnaJ domain